MPAMNRRELLAVGGAAIGTALVSQSAVAAAPNKAVMIYPGQPWLDQAGKPIHAHGGSILQVGSTYFWYGENKERTLPGSGIWQWGMRMYSSVDLVIWKDEGLFIPPDLKDPKSTFAPSSYTDRPHIIFNKRTNKYVCWAKQMHPADWSQTRTVLVADTITGPYHIVRENQRPVGMSAGDFDLFVAADGKAYMIFERTHSAMIVAELTDDYLDFNGIFSSHLPAIGMPYAREGLSYFTRNGKHYVFSSATTGYHPNQTLVAMGESIHGPWTTVSAPHVGDTSLTSFNSQICSVFKHPGKKDLYVALADRWITNLPELEGAAFASGQASRDYWSFTARRFAPGASGAVPPGDERFDAIDQKVDTSKARYVWLPIRFDGDLPYIEWRHHWSFDEFA
jgi:hypothetical protein